MAKGLLGLEMPLPQEVRSNIANRLFSSQPVFGGIYGPAYTAAGSIGRSLGLMAAGPSPEEQQATAFQRVNEEFVDSFGDDFDETSMNSPEWMRENGPKYVKMLAEAGLTEQAMTAAAAIPPAVNPKVQEGIGKRIGAGREKLEARAAEVVSSMSRIQQLAGPAAAGNRSARGAMGMQVAKLAQGAGVITDKDVAAVSGASDSLGYVLSVLQGKPATEAFLRGIDPYGESFNANDLLSVANALVASGRDSINNRLSDYRTQADAAGYGEADINALFAGDRNIQALNALSTDMTVDVQPQQKPSPKSKQAGRFIVEEVTD